MNVDEKGEEKNQEEDDIMDNTRLTIVQYLRDNTAERSQGIEESKTTELRQWRRIKNVKNLTFLSAISLRIALRVTDISFY